MSKPIHKSPPSERRINKRLAELISALLEDKDIGSFRSLAKFTGVDYQAIYKWSNFRTDPSLERLTDFAYGLGWSMKELMEFAEGDEDPHHAVARIKKNHQFNSSSRKKSTSKANPSKTFSELATISS